MNHKVFVGIFLHTKLIQRIGLPVPATPTNIALLDWFITQLDKHYQPVGEEYIAYEYC